VERASVSQQLPFSGDFSSSVILPEGYVPPAGESVLSPFQTDAGADYFETMGIPLREGRTFEARDLSSGERVIILDEWLAERYFPGQSPLGKRMLYGTVPGLEADPEPFLFTVVGVVGSHRQGSLEETGYAGHYFFPIARTPEPNPYLLLRTGEDPLALVQPVRRVVTRLDAELPFFGVRTMEDRVAESLLGRRSPMLLLAIFAGVALFLAALGIYGALAYSVTQRTREVGIRVAVGSTSGKVFRLVLGEGLRVVGIGLLLGAGGSLGLVGLIRSLLYGIGPGDPVVMGSVAALLAATGVVACILPARRATRIDPVVALAGE
jgi:predicted permease